MSATPSRPTDTGPSSTPQDTSATPTVASFSPVSISHVPASIRQRSTILVHQKSPLLVATPPQITRALAYSHPFLLPLNKFVGLVTWTSGDPWESFLLVASFWAIVSYGDLILRWGAPPVVVVGLVLGMYSRRYSPLSSSGWPGTAPKHKKRRSDTSEETMTRHQKSLDEIVETLNVFTSRCNVLLDPMISFTHFLSTQQSATSATTRPALTILFVRILMLTPLWIALTFPPIGIITTQRLVLTVGMLILTWHSRPARVSRAILWRSLFVRQVCTIITGLRFGDASTQSKGNVPPPPPRGSNVNDQAFPPGKKRPTSPGVRFTFILYENERRWLGLGWTHSLFAYERAPWTDEHLNAAPSKDAFELPEVDGGATRWRWALGSDWQVEGASDGEEGAGKRKKGEREGEGGWIYYDNKVPRTISTHLFPLRVLIFLFKWRDGKRGQDTWGRYTRRRKWYRDAELVESSEITPRLSPSPSTVALSSTSDATTAVDPPPEYSEVAKDGTTASDTASISTTASAKKRRWFRNAAKNQSKTSVDLDGAASVTGSVGNEDEQHESLRHRQERDGDWGVGDDAEMGLS